MTNTQNVFIVEDDEILRDAIVAFLRGAGVRAMGFFCGDELDEQLPFTEPSLLILDIKLPGENGYQIARRMRASIPDLYIVMLTDLKSEAEKLHGYEVGADFYLSKPIAPAELIAVTKAVFRRIAPRSPRGLNVSFSPARSEVRFIDQSAVLNSMEKHLLLALIHGQGESVPSWRLFEVLSRASGVTVTKKAYLEMQIFRLRKKLQAIGTANPSIIAVWKDGYKLLLDIEVTK